MRYFLFFILFVSTQSYGQRLKKADQAIIKDLKTTVTFLADDKMEGRRTGTPGEKMAYEYLEKEIKSIGLLPKGDNNSYFQTFEINEGKEVRPATNFSIDEENLEIGTDYFPFVFSANGTIDHFASPAIKESDAPWFLDIKEMMETNANNPHFDLAEAIRKKAAENSGKGANSLIVYNSGTDQPDLKFDGKSKVDAVDIPVVFINGPAAKKYLSEKTADHKLKFEVSIGEKKRKGTNVIGFLDNGAPTTIVLGAHYDHLGYGEDKNTLWTGKPEIHNGADDNASGTAVVLELSKLLKKSKLKNNNYLFLFFSGEELGLFGSKYFTEHPTIALNSINYMINMDMVGRLSEEAVITVGGYGTSPEWARVLPEKTKSLTVKFDSSGIGPSDHTSFYLKDIPVLFFFTGTHTDYHKPGDDADKINYVGQYRILQYIYDVIKKTNTAGKLAFLKTKEPQMSGAKFTVSLGIMPDYTYAGKGVHVDGVIEGRPGEKAGMQTGDVVLKIGDFIISDINEYMTALSKFKKGDSTKIIVQRGGQELEMNIEF